MARKPLLIAGIGASAGGLEALRGLLRPFAADTGIALVLMTHMPRGQDSALGEIIARYTSMPVRVAADGEPVEPNHVYVCPPDHLLTVVDDRLRLERDAVAHHKPIDVFLSSLAHARGDAAIGILLSGGGSDGAIGLKHIKECGGLTIAQGGDGNRTETERHARCRDRCRGGRSRSLGGRDGGKARRICPRLPLRPG